MCQSQKNQKQVLISRLTLGDRVRLCIFQKSLINVTSGSINHSNDRWRIRTTFPFLLLNPFLSYKGGSACVFLKTKPKNSRINFIFHHLVWRWRCMTLIFLSCVALKWHCSSCIIFFYKLKYHLSQNVVFSFDKTKCGGEYKLLLQMFPCIITYSYLNRFLKSHIQALLSPSVNDFMAHWDKPTQGSSR